MIKKFIAKLVGWKEKEMDFSKRTFNERSTGESRVANEKEKAHEKMIEEHQEPQWRETSPPTEIKED